MAEIWTASQGNVLLVRELVLGALDRGTSSISGACGASSARW